LFEKRAEAGGLLRRLSDEGKLPRDVLDAEIAVIERLGASFELGTQIGRDLSLEDVCARFDAVLIATGTPEEPEDECLGISVREGRIPVNRRTHETSVPGVFAAGDAVRPNKLVVRSVADGKAVATSIDQHLRGIEVTGPPVPFNIPAGKMTDEELAQLASGAGQGPRVAPSDDLTEQQAHEEALRCLHCDCGKQEDCRLRRYAEAYGAKASRYRGDRRSFERHVQHGEVIYEPGKCILCGLCVQIAAEAREPLGLTFVGRGFNVRVGVPFNGTIAEALRHTARRCAEACPTGAIVLAREQPGAPSVPKERVGDTHRHNTGTKGV
jgi:ferredoxin